MLFYKTNKGISRSNAILFCEYTHANRSARVTNVIEKLSRLATLNLNLQNFINANIQFPFDILPIFVRIICIVITKCENDDDLSLHATNVTVNNSNRLFWLLNSCNLLQLWPLHRAVLTCSFDSICDELMMRVMIMLEMKWNERITRYQIASKSDIVSVCVCIWSGLHELHIYFNQRQMTTVWTKTVKSYAVVVNQVKEFEHLKS